MASNNYENLANLKPGRYDYKIRVRVIRFWRVVTRTGEEYKCFNVMLIDNKKTRIHAFCPTAFAEKNQKHLKVGNVCTITNFTVQTYKAEEKFRCLRNDKQLVFTKDTKIEEIDNNNLQIPQDDFNFYDHSELMELSKQTTYLADVVGIIKTKFNGVNEVHSRRGEDQCQAKFTITDGKSNIKVTFWDKYAQCFAQAMSQENLEKPVIIIIATCRVGLWNEEVDISNVGATKFYLNYNHHSVVQMRKMLSKPEFAKQIFAKPGKKIAELLTVEDVKKLPKEAIGTQVLTHVKIESVEETKMWYSNCCSTCNQQTEKADEYKWCANCKKIVPHPQKKFEISVMASDETGAIEVIPGDQQVRMLIGTRAQKLFEKVKNSTKFPEVLKNIVNKEYTIKLRIKETNIVDKIEVFLATNICNGFQLEQEDTKQYNEDTLPTSIQATSSTYHLQGMSDLNCQST